MVDIIGIDCSTEARNVGLARFDSATERIVDVVCGGRDLVDQVESWIHNSDQTLLALDAPLGWPASFSELASHNAGERVATNREDTFNRITDRFVYSKLGQTPLRVGADRIAMTAHWALEFLDNLMHRLGLSIPLAWDSDFAEKVAVIEVYPAATLRSCGMPYSGYKKATRECSDVREWILKALQREIDVSNVTDALVRDADLLDGAVCCLGGLDFIHDRCFTPPLRSIGLVKKEGWIWVRRTSSQPLSLS